MNSPSAQPASPRDCALAALLLEQIELFLAGAATPESVAAALPDEPAHPSLADIRRELLATLAEPRDHWETMRAKISLDAELLSQFEWHWGRIDHCRVAVWDRIHDYTFLNRNEIGAEVRRCLEDCPPYQLKGFHSGR